MPRALIVVTNHAHFDGTDRATGAWLAEITHFHAVMAAHDIAVDYVSPAGGFVPLDPDSLAEAELDEVSWRYYGDASYRKKYLAHSFAPIQVTPAAYDLIYFAGGQGVMWDFPNDQTLGRLANTIYAQGGIIAAVSHGVVGLLAMGEFIHGKHLTGNPFEEEPLRGAGALVEKTADPAHVVVDERLITGQDSAAAKAVGEAAIKLLQQA